MGYTCLICLDLVVITELSPTSPTFCCSFTAVSQDKAAKDYLQLHRETQTYSSSTGDRSVHFHKHSQEGNTVCEDILGNERCIGSARVFVGCSGCEQCRATKVKLT